MSAKKDVVLFDGVCNLCNGAVHFILDRDPDERMQFASLQSDAGKELLRTRGFPIPEGDPNSVLLVVDERVYDGSGAALRIAARMKWPWKIFAVFLVVPWFLRDLVYYVIAKNRYRLFGKSEACRVPTPELRARFLT